MKRKLSFVAALVAVVLGADIVTKRWALAALDHGSTIEGVGGIPLTLAYNTGIAFGLDVPSAMRWILIAASIFVVVMLAGLYVRAREEDWLRLAAIGLVTAGAIGNLIDRVRWEQGVVDFIGPFDLGLMQWPIFNIADMAITVGAIALGISLWREDAASRAVTAPVLESSPEPGD